MTFPKFLIADNSQNPSDLFIVHTEYPCFVLNVSNDEIHWMEEFSKEDEAVLKESTSDLLEAAYAFYDTEMKHLED
ncbi:MAG: hypothetical protein ACPGVF_06440 [Flavobacteriaceae bacterium]